MFNEDIDFGYSIDNTASFLTVEQLEAAFELLKNQPVEVCGVTMPHVVHPRTKDGEWAMCGNCFTPVQIPVGFEARNA